MIKFIFLFSFLSVLLIARENPFFPSSGETDMPITSNQVNRLEPLKRATLTLPSTARTLESVTVEYTNLDGSIGTKKIQLHNAIDWHLPLFISQNYGASPEVPKLVSKKGIKKSVHKPVYKQIVVLPFIKFYADAKELKVLTKDKLLRNFLLVKPHRIVCDFARQTDIRSYVKHLPKPYLFKEIRVGTHKGYYRVVIELDGYYQYKVEKTAVGYLFTLL